MTDLNAALVQHIPLLLLAILGLLVATVGGLTHLHLKSRGWSIPFVSARLDTLEAAHVTTRRMTETNERHLNLQRTEVERTTQSILAEVRSIGERVDGLLILRDTVRDIDDRVQHVEREYGGIAAALQTLGCLSAQRNGVHPPGFCPLHDKMCPLVEKKEET